MKNIYLDTRLVWLPESAKLNLERLDLRLESFYTVSFKVSIDNLSFIASQIEIAK